MNRVANKKLWSRLDALRDRPERPSLAEAASTALDCGLSPDDALREAVRFTSCGRASDSDTSDAVARFLTAMCSGVNNTEVLELSDLPGLFSPAIFEGIGKAAGQIVSRNVDNTEAYAVLFPGSVVLNTLDQLVPDASYQYIVCQPPFGTPLKRGHSDGYGGEVVAELAPRLSSNGCLFWLTGRGALHSVLVAQRLAELAKEGLHAFAQLEVPSGAFTGTNLEAALVVFARQESKKKLVGALRDPETAPSVAAALKNGPTKKPGAGWAWLDAADPRSYSDLEREQLLTQLVPRGRHIATPLSAILLDEKIEKADKALNAKSVATAYLYVPEYATSRVTVDLEEQTVKTRAVYRVPIDTRLANPHFLAILLNGSYGRELRSMAAQGTTIQRISTRSLRNILLPLPPLEIQNQIARIDGDVALLASSFDEIKDSLQRDWTNLPGVAEQVEGLKAVLDIEQQIENWWRELPYPLATIYRRYQISTDPKERLDRLLHFFEMAAVYLATIGTSHVQALRQDWQEHFSKWFHPVGVAGIERADFGFWIMLAGASLKELSRIVSTPELRAAATDLAGPELVQVASTLGGIGKTTETLDTVRRYRNSWKGHGGHLKTSDANRLDKELQQYVRDFFEATASTFKRFVLVRPGLADVSDSGYTYQVDILAGSDPAFERETIELNRPAKSHTLAFWAKDTRAACRALPFFRLGAPQEPQETSFYVFNRVENGGFRWISYQEAREQEFVAPDEELTNLITLPKRAGA